MGHKRDKDGVDWSLMPFLKEDHPLARKLFFMKMKRFNRKAEKWGYETRFYFDFQRHIVCPQPYAYLDRKKPSTNGFWNTFKVEYRNNYLNDLAGQIIYEAISMQDKMPYLKRLWKFCYFWLNYP
jgi:hypothetical protein